MQKPPEHHTVHAPGDSGDRDLERLFREQRSREKENGMPGFAAMWQKAEALGREQESGRRKKPAGLRIAWKTGFAAVCTAVVITAVILGPDRRDIEDAGFIRQAEAISSWQPATAVLLPSPADPENTPSIYEAGGTTWKTPTDYFLESLGEQELRNPQEL